MGYRRQAALLTVLGLLATHGALAQDTAAEDECVCTKEYVKQCNSTGQEVASNPCVAACNGFTPQEANNWLCGELDEAAWDDYFADWDEADLPAEYVLFTVKSLTDVTCESKCSGYQPVCDKFGSALADSACLAECKGYSPTEFSIDFCDTGYRDSVLCGCEGEAGEPICDVKGTTVGANECIATCFGYSGEDYVAANCDIQKPLCICALIYAPVCDKMGTKYGDNYCTAQCSYGAEEMDAFSEPACAPYIRESAACGCTEPENAVCDALGTVVAASPCIATCAGYTEAKPCTDIFIGFSGEDQVTTEIVPEPSKDPTPVPTPGGDPSVISIGDNSPEVTTGPEAPGAPDSIGDDDSKAAQLAPVLVQAVVAGLCLVAALM